MTKRFSFIEFASASNATPCFSYARTAIAGIAIAASPAGIMPADNNAGRPTNATNRAPKANSIIATASASTGADAIKDRPA
jgi:hypothetical protein